MADVTNSVIQRVVNETTGGTWGLGVVTASATADGGSTSNATLTLITSLVFAESKSIRTSTIILAVFNVIAAVGTAASILYDCYWASRRCNPKFKTSKFCVSWIHPAETFPLVIAMGIAVQGLIFVGVQSTGLSSLFIDGCSVIAQFLWPALFIVPYLQTVFGLECAIRSVRKHPFQPRGKYDVTICGITVAVMLFGTWLPSNLSPEPDVCFASLVWYISSFGLWALALLATSTGLMLVSALTIFIRLSTTKMIDQNQRIAASRMVYYLVLGIVSLAFVIPYFVSQITSEGDLKAAMIATVVLNLSGLMTGLLQMFLRSNTATTSFGVKYDRSWDKIKHDIKLFGPNELPFMNYQTHLASPVAGPHTPNKLEKRTSSLTHLTALEKETGGRGYSMESIRSPPPTLSPTTYNPLTSNAVTELKPMPKISEPTPPNSASRSHGRKKSYSLFPAEETTSPAQTSLRQQEPTSVYDISELLAPPSLFGGRGHRRDSSMASSATVQIGLRLSHAPFPSDEEVSSMPLPATTYNNTALPSTTYKAANLPLPSTTYSADTSRRPVSPLRVNTNVGPKQEIPIPMRSPFRPSPLSSSKVPSPTASDLAIQRQISINKTLPRTPKPLVIPTSAFSQPQPALAIPTSTFSRLAGSTTQLSPTVYTPEPKKSRDRSPGEPQSATIPKKNPFRDSLIQTPQRSNSNRQPESRGQWI